MRTWELGAVRAAQRGGLLVLMLALAAAGLLGGPPAAPAAAESDLCLGDPLILLDGRPLDIQVLLPLAQLPLFQQAGVTARNPIVVKVWVPSNVQANLSVTFSPLYPMRVDYARADPVPAGPMTIRFAIYAPDSGAATRYTAGVVANSGIDSRTGQFPSGSWSAFTIRAAH